MSGLNGQKLADVPGGSIVPGAGLQLYSANGTAAQSFYFVDPTAVRSELDKLASVNREVVKDGDYAIVAGPDLSRMVLDVVAALLLAVQTCRSINRIRLPHSVGVFRMTMTATSQ